MKEFYLDGEPLYALTPIFKIKDLKEQMLEIERRLIALRNYCIEEKTVLTPLHIRNVLVIGSDTFNRYLRGVVQDKNGRIIRVRESDLPKEEVELIEERAKYLRRWMDYARQWVLDDVSTQHGIGAIYISKSIFHNWDTPQTKQDNKLSVEMLVRKAAEKVGGD